MTALFGDFTLRDRERRVSACPVGRGVLRGNHFAAHMKIPSASGLLADGVDLSDKRNGGLVEAAELSIISLSAHQKSEREVAFFDKVAFCVARNRASRAT